MPNDAYVAFKEEKSQENITTLRSPTAIDDLEKSNSEFFGAWLVSFGRGSPPDPQSTIYIRVLEKYPNTNIYELQTVSQSEFDRIRNSQHVAVFQPYKDFEAAAQATQS